MLSKDQFDSYLRLVNKIKDTRYELEQLGVELDDAIYDDFYYIMDMVIDSNFDEVGRDTFFGYLYEDLKEIEEDGVFYSLDNKDDLWNFMVKHYNHEPTEEVPYIY